MNERGDAHGYAYRVMPQSKMRTRLREGGKRPTAVIQRVHAQLYSGLHLGQDCPKFGRSARRGVRVYIQRPGLPGWRIFRRHNVHRPVALPENAQEHHIIPISAHVETDDEKRLQHRRLSDSEAEVPHGHQISLRHYRNPDQLPAGARP